MELPSTSTESTADDAARLAIAIAGILHKLFDIYYEKDYAYFITF
jgi:hypothetical protein